MFYCNSVRCIRRRLSACDISGFYSTSPTWSTWSTWSTETMGHKNSKTLPPGPLGCWKAFGGTGSKVGYGKAFTIDCDCRSNRTCPFGPPPPPSMREFLRVSDEVAEKCDELIRPAVDKTWDPAWGTQTKGWAVNTFFKVPKYVKVSGAKGNDRYRVKHDKHIKYDEPNKNTNYMETDGYRTHGRRQTGTAHNSTFDYLDYEATILQVFNFTSPEQKTAIDQRFGNGISPEASRFRRSEDVSTEAEHKFLFALLLAEPNRHAQSIISVLPGPAFETVRFCAAHAVRLTLQAIEKERLQKTRARKMGPEAANYTLSRRETPPDEVDYMLMLGSQYLAHMSREKQRLMLTDADTGRMNRTCSAVFQGAMDDFQRGLENRYVAAFPIILYSFKKRSIFNPLFAGIRAPHPIEELGPKFDLTEESLEMKFGSAFPALAVGLNFLTLGLHAEDVEAAKNEPFLDLEM